VGYILVTKIGISCKFHTNDQQMKLCMLSVNIIHVKCVNITMNHHLQLDVGCDLVYATNEFLLTCVDYNLFIVTNYNYKLTFFS
jgi:hypothetical protein